MYIYSCPEFDSQQCYFIHVSSLDVRNYFDYSYVCISKIHISYRQEQLEIGAMAFLV